MSDPGLMGRAEAERVQADFRRGVVAWVVGGGAGALASLALLFASFPLGNGLVDGAMAGLNLAMAFMGVATIGLLGSVGGSAIGVAARWASWQGRLSAAGRVLAAPAPTSPEWEVTQGRLRECLARAEDPEVRRALEGLHAGLQDQVRLGVLGGPGSDAERRARELVAEADATARRLLEAAEGPDGVPDALALLQAHAEVEAAHLRQPGVERARAAAASRAREGG